MNKKNITVKDLKKLISEEEVRGLSVTNKAKKESGKFNKQGLKDAKNKLSDYFKSIGAEDQYSKDMAPNKYNYNDSFEKTYHDEMEILNGQEMIQYDSNPDSRFMERAKEAIEGSSNMGNNPEWANVIPAQQGFTGPDFGKNLVKRIKNSAKKRSEDTPAISLRGKDIQELPTKKIDNGHKPYAIKENNNKTQIKETMKRLVFKKDFNGVGNALKLIPESYKVDNKIFEMTDGNENYRIRWEGNSNKGKAVILIASDKNLVNEDMQRMKQLFSYKSQDTLGTLKGNERIDENKKFSDIWGKTKSLLIENEDMTKEEMVKKINSILKNKGVIKTKDVYGGQAISMGSDMGLMGYAEEFRFGKAKVGYYDEDRQSDSEEPEEYSMVSYENMTEKQLMKILEFLEDSRNIDESMSKTMDEDLYENEYLLEFDDKDDDDEEEEEEEEEDDDDYGDEDEDEDEDEEPSDIAPEDVKPADVPKEEPKADVPDFKLFKDPKSGDYYMKSGGKLEKLSGQLLSIAKDDSLSPSEKKINIDKVKRGKM